jgi:hypothetical protein
LKSLLYKHYVVSEYAKYPYMIMIVQDGKGKLITIEVSKFENE